MAEDREEEESLLKALYSFKAYDTQTFASVCHSRRVAFYGLPSQSKELLPDYLKHIKALEERIHANSSICQEIYTTGIKAFGSSCSDDQEVSSFAELERVWSTLKLFWRDWSRGENSMLLQLIQMVKLSVENVTNLSWTLYRVATIDLRRCLS